MPLAVNDSGLGLLAPPFFSRSYVCPRWVRSLQQAEHSRSQLTCFGGRLREEDVPACLAPIGARRTHMNGGTGVLQERKFRARLVCVRGIDSSGIVPPPCL
mmetsp:Transcript_72461/g.121450  ORF Transcript_72461/g.121450 Transcript_72461/m.121450 type:complete len:101 (+) Transcript_72461:785-1087(+)